MNLKTIHYDNQKVLKAYSNERNVFRGQASTSNVLYFFYKGDECLYIGESETSLYHRCFKHSPKEKDQPWFKEADTINIIELDSNIDKFSRQTLESTFILTHKPKYNKKA